MNRKRRAVVTLPERGEAGTSAASAPATLAKVPTGVAGLDDILAGGFPAGRPTLVCGGAGCGKTLLAMEFVCRGATEYEEPGVFVAFEESPEELAANVASLGFDLPGLQAQGLVSIDHVRLDSAEIVETGAYDLEPLFIRIVAAADAVGAKIAVPTLVRKLPVPIRQIIGDLSDTEKVLIGLQVR